MTPIFFFDSITQAELHQFNCVKHHVIQNIISLFFAYLKKIKTMYFSSNQTRTDSNRLDLFIPRPSCHTDQLHQAEGSLTPTADLIRRAHSWIDFPGQQHKRVHMSLTSCHKAGAASKGLLGGTAVHHSVINTYTTAVSATFHSQVFTDSVMGQLVRHIYFNNSLME